MGFSQVAEHFIKNGWSVGINTQTEISFNHQSDPNLAYDEFRLNAAADKVTVLIPMPNSKVAYCTWFKDYFAASEYVIQRFDDFLQAVTKADMPAEKEYESD
tara:strand:+ start:2012 stop:2317 length:306 start_codon:yes stop_codon:yes gene_type:complete